MSKVQRVSPVVEQAIAAVLNREDRGDTISITATLNAARQAAPHLVASDEELTEAIVEAATALGLSVAFDRGE
ncbi:hypothetical protein NKJ46_14680 [Mesorhizobium sp. M0166]|uniref:hypothetical protein n=1 Tax=unclassified Mesorhizobium TaxID=325217 RepID=UPI003334B70C